MSILADWQIADLCKNKQMIFPFVDKSVNKVTVGRRIVDNNTQRTVKEEVGILSHMYI